MDKRLATENKLNIKSTAELRKVEEREAKKVMIEMWESNELAKFQSGSVQQLRYTHFKTFYNIYDWAGKIRDVQISKDGFSFSNVQYIHESLKMVETMPNNNFEEIIDKYAEMNVVHPFREGNGRTTRVWLDDMLRRNISKVVDWNNIGEREYLEAMIKSHVNTLDLKVLLKENLTDKLYDRQIFFKGIDSSYYYEGMNEFVSEEIANDINEAINIKNQYINSDINP